MKQYEATWVPLNTIVEEIVFAFKANSLPQAKFIAFRFMEQSGGGKQLVIKESNSNFEPMHLNDKMHAVDRLKYVYQDA
jgi:hypothetical protein